MKSKRNAFDGMGGAYAALYTPFKKDGSINEEMVEKLVEHGIDNGLKGFYLTGSTGEGFLLSNDERVRVYRRAVKAAKGRVKLIAQVACMSTDDVVALAKAAEMCQIGDFMRTPVARLSAGLRKRVALADALLLRPRVLLLDDFLSGLDLEMREAAGEMLSSAAAFSSVIATGHDIWDFAQWTTRFLVLRGGVVAAKIETSGIDQATLRERVEFAMRGSGR